MSWKVILLAFCVSFVFGEPAGNGSEPLNEAEEIQGGTTPVPFAFLEKWDDWLTLEKPADIPKLAPYYKSGYDYDGLPIIIIKYGKWVSREIAHLKPDQLDRFWKLYDQFVRRAESEGAANNNAGVVFIADWDGFLMENYTNNKSLEMILKVCASFARLKNAIRYGYMININFGAETIMNMARPFLGDFLDVFEMHGSQKEKWKPALLRKIPASQIPPDYGGDKTWKPAKWNEK